ncbi:ribonuclease D [Leptospira sp. GIMC2001]|uniref:ribonuclease D n=1 Tax=Leptospira sp. GIMC2001 TaxID=1513297 RepID=UPI00234B8AA5|nr:ribonuclease D [Leptospira sp. GIMC2001]WCL49668.1 HRDC domain-containing protein [Leptospira sp. GIMC2001]
MQINSSYIMVDNPKNLELALFNLRNAPIISIDTESSGYFTYYAKVCLIQITAKSKNYIIDPLKLDKLDALGEIFKDANVLKIFHSASDDIKALKKDFHFDFVNVADTMLSSRYLGMEHNSLYALVEHYHHKKLDKEFQKSNWELRPLKKDQLQYAAMDTAYLESIWEKMEKELRDRKLYDEAKSEFEFVAQEDISQKEGESINLARFPDVVNLSPVDRGKVYQILMYREEKAKRVNRAPFRVLNNEAIVRLVGTEMNEDNFITTLGKKDGSELFQIMKESKIEPIEASDLNKRVGEDLEGEEKDKFRRLKKWKEAVQKARRMEHSLLPSSKHLIQIIRANPTSIEDLKSIRTFSDWKCEHYGPAIVSILKGEPFDEKSLQPMAMINSKRGLAMAKKRKPSSAN